MAAPLLGERAGSAITSVSGRLPQVTRWLRVSVRVASVVWASVVLALLGALVAVKAAGWRIEAIASASMSPAIPKGAAAVVAPLGPAAIARLGPGDVILFRHPKAARLVMHRVVQVIEQDGVRFFETKGDANDAPDARLVPQSDVESRVQGSVPRLGGLLTRLKPPGGLFWLVVVPWALVSLPRHLLRQRADALPGAALRMPDSDDGRGRA
jgi:signal peptidase